DSSEIFTMTNVNEFGAAPAPEQLPPDAQLFQLIAGAFISQAIYVTAKLGIADLVADGPKDVKYLAEKTASQERALYRILRACASVGAFTQVEGRKFANTPMTETLRSDNPRSTRDLTIWLAEEPHWRVYGEMLYCAKTGKPSWDKVHGEP